VENVPTDGYEFTFLAGFHETLNDEWTSLDKLHIMISSFSLAQQLRVSFGLLNNQPPFLSVLHLFRR
jgi:hypothetical protein